MEEWNNSDQVKYIQEVNRLLRSLSDKGARWWHYSVSHRHLEVLIGDPIKDDNLVLCLVARSFITGPVSWVEQRIEVVWWEEAVDENRTRNFIMKDDMVGFKATGKMFIWKIGFDLCRYECIYTPQTR